MTEKEPVLDYTIGMHDGRSVQNFVPLRKLIIKMNIGP
jgi:hypothetical protein